MRLSSIAVASLAGLALAAAWLPACHRSSDASSGGAGGMGGAGSTSTGPGGTGGMVVLPPSTIPCGAKGCTVPQVCCGSPSGPTCVAAGACTAAFHASCLDDTDCVLSHCCAVIQWGPDGGVEGAHTDCEATCSLDDTGTPGGPFQATGPSCTNSFSCPNDTSSPSCCALGAFPIAACVYDVVDVSSMGAICD